MYWCICICVYINMTLSKPSEVLPSACGGLQERHFQMIIFRFLLNRAYFQ